jgi:hypothetical protein
MEAMGASDVRAGVGTIAAFAAAQDVYEAAASAQREIAGVLTQAWWAKDISGNTVTVAVGSSTRQFVRLATGTYSTLGAGAPSTLVWTGGRSAYNKICTAAVAIGWVSQAIGRGGLSTATRARLILARIMLHEI